MKRIYLDSSCIIYMNEAASSLHRATVSRFMAYSKSGDVEVVTSRLSRLECRVKPLREGNHEQLAAYDAFFDKGGLRLIEVSAAVLERATELRARLKLQTADAIQAASAIVGGADVLLTGDSEFTRVQDVPVEVVTDSVTPGVEP